MRQQIVAGWTGGKVACALVAAESMFLVNDQIDRGGEICTVDANFDRVTVAKLADGKPNSGHYGFGWFIESRNGRHIVEHEGQWQGFETQISRYVDTGLTVVVLTNLDSARPQEIADKVAAIYLSNKPVP